MFQVVYRNPQCVRNEGFGLLEIRVCSSFNVY